jgi:molybdate transport system substrate-binding protein
MNLRRTFLAGLAPITIAGAAGAAGLLRVACASGFKPAMARIAVALEAPLYIDYGEASVLLQRPSAGERPDLVVLPRSALEPLVQQGALVADTLADFATTDPLGIAVGHGDPPPTNETIEDFRRWLLGLGSIAVTDPAVGGPSVRQFLEVIERLGIANDMKPKLIAVPGVGASNAQYVTSGRTQAAVQQSHLLCGVDGIDLVPVPSEFRGTVTFTAGVVAGSVSQDAATAFIRYLHGPVAAQAIEASGMRKIP